MGSIGQVGVSSPRKCTVQLFHHLSRLHTFAAIDTQASVSGISYVFARRIGSRMAPVSQHLQLANGVDIHITSQTKVEFRLPSGQSFVHTFLVFPHLLCDVLLGWDVLQYLPIVVTMDGNTIFRGAPMVQPRSHRPTKNVGEGIRFQGGTPQEQQQVKELLCEFQSNIHEWSGVSGFFVILLKSCRWGRMNLQLLSHFEFP